MHLFRKLLSAGLLAVASTMLPAAPAVPGSQVPTVQVRDLPAGRRVHGSAVAGGWLYVFGGKLSSRVVPAPGGEMPTLNGARMTTSVLRAKIDPDGALGEWADARPLPGPRGFIVNSTVSLDDYIYIVGGSDGLEDIGLGGTKYKTALVTRPGSDGSLEPWRESPPFPGPGLSCFTVSALSGYLYIIGGNTASQAASREVIMGRIGEDGNVEAWEKGPALPVPIWFHHTAVAGGRMWVWGGLTGQTGKTATSTVYSASILASGRLSPWVAESPALPTGMYRGAKASAGPYLLCFMPTYGSPTGTQMTNDVVYASRGEGGGLFWSRRATSLVARNFVAAAPDYRHNTIYVSGGSPHSSINKDADIRTVSMFRLNTPIAEDAGMPAMLAQGKVPSPFTDWRGARAEAAQAARPTVMYFHLDNSKPSDNQLASIAGGSDLVPLKERATFAWVSVGDSPQTAQQFGVFRVPTWIVFNARGEEKVRLTRSVTASELEQALQGIHQ